MDVCNFFIIVTIVIIIIIIWMERFIQTNTQLYLNTYTKLNIFSTSSN